MSTFAKYILLTGMALTLVSCNKFLEEQPSKSSSIPISSISQLEALLDDYEQFSNEEDNTVNWASDDSYISEEFFKRPIGFTVFSIGNIQQLLWDIPNIPFATGESLWSEEYRKIFLANTVLNYAKDPKIAATTEQRAALIAEAHFIRAYSMFQLTQAYCLPYTDANKNELGLPLRRTINFEESLVRSTLAETHQMIEADIQEALKLKTSLTENDRAKTWRASKASVNAFAARYFLTRSNYVKALEYADLSLTEHSSLLDYNNPSDMTYGIESKITINGTSEQATIKFPFTRDFSVAQKLGHKETIYFRQSQGTWYIPSPALLALYSEDDLRNKYHIVKNYSYYRGYSNPAFEYPGYVTYRTDAILVNLITGPTTAEMLLIKAECLARANDIIAAMEAVNILRSNRILRGSANVILKASSKDEAVRMILEERRREMPFTRRWSDIKRYNSNDDPSDDVNELTRAFYPYNSTTILTDRPVMIYRLPKGSRRFALPIPNTEVIGSRQQIKQNTY